MTTPTAEPISQLDHVRVVMARYPGEERVDVIDVRPDKGLAALLSLPAAEAVQIAQLIYQVAGWIEPVRGGR